MLAEQLLSNDYKNDLTLLRRILSPYTPTGTDYLKSTKRIPVWEQKSDSNSTSIASMSGEFSIEDSCYIKATGHFNAVEFLICYNQLAYSLFGTLVNDEYFKNRQFDSISPQCNEALSSITLNSFFDNQLSSMFILRASTKFKKIINAKKFSGNISADKFRFKQNTIFIDTSCTFKDDSGGYADGNIMLVYPLKTK